MVRAVPFVAIASMSLVALRTAEAPATVPLCPGLTIVTAVSQPDGDYESIKTVEAITDAAVRLKYSTERTVQDIFTNTEPQLQKISLHRSVRLEDLKTATLYQQQFSTELPETIPETTAIGTSAAVLRALKTKGQAQLGIFIAYSQIKPSLDRSVHPNVYDNQMIATIRRVGTAPVTLPVIVNDARVELPVIQAQGEFFGDKSEFFFLDDERNPLTLIFRVGIDAIKPPDAVMAKVCADLRASGAQLPSACAYPKGGDRDVLRVVKIAYPCAAPPPAAEPSATAAAAGTNASGASALETALAETGKADVYRIYFTFNSDVIRDESEPTLIEIAALLRRHADWKLGVNGHTDNIASDQYNLTLSQKRAAAVKDALVARHRIDASRLTTAGFGESHPKDTNDTLEGRARNRRVELIRQ